MGWPEDDPDGVIQGRRVLHLRYRGLAQLDAPVDLDTDERTGLPVLSIGRRVTSVEIAELLDEE